MRPGLDKFIKLMMLTTSDNDGEALAALRKANAMLRERHMTRAELFEPPPDPRHARPRRPRPDRDRSRAPYIHAHDDEARAHVNQMFDAVMTADGLSDAGQEFVTGVWDFWRARGYLTVKQYDALCEMARKHEAA